MVQSPVGARCPDCASIGQAPIFRATPGELTTTIAISIGGAVVLGIAYALVVWLLWSMPLGYRVGNVAAALVIGLAGAPVGEFVRRAGKYKLDARLRVVAAVTMFAIWTTGFIVAVALGVWIDVFLNIVAYIGLGVGIYVAMNRVRP
ncbi:MAG: hypothetical protein QF357_06435, partial [Dehalococcoidia bacterium]|jgi:hypothetical protein|nr:hypothetical protein [Dehalococcoidia bacterium]